MLTCGRHRVYTVLLLKGLADIIPGHNLPGSEPPCQWQGRTKSPGHNRPVELEHNV